MRGCIAKAPAIATRCFCPPDSVATSLRSMPESPTRSRAQATRSCTASAGSPRFRGPKATSFPTKLATI